MRASKNCPVAYKSPKNSNGFKHASKGSKKFQQAELDSKKPKWPQKAQYVPKVHMEQERKVEGLGRRVCDLAKV